MIILCMETLVGKRVVYVMLPVAADKNGCPKNLLKPIIAMLACANSQTTTI